MIHRQTCVGKLIRFDGSLFKQENNERNDSGKSNWMSRWFGSGKRKKILHDPHEGEEEDDTEWFYQAWLSQVQQWLTHASRTFVSEYSNEIVLSPFVNPEKMAAMCQLCRVVVLSCMHETRKWFEATDSATGSATGSATNTTNTTNDTRQQNKVDLTFCNEYLQLLIDASVIFLVWSRHCTQYLPALMHNPTADAKTAAATAVALEATEESNKLRSLGPTTTDMLDTAAALLHCARHLIRRSLPTLNALNATASKTTSSNTEGNFENVKHLNHLEHLIKLIHQSTELDKYAHELDELKDNMTDIFYILASLDTSLEVVYHRSDLVRCFSCCCCLRFFFAQNSHLFFGCFFVYR